MNNEPCRYCQFNGTQGCPFTNCGVFPHCPQGLKIKRTNNDNKDRIGFRNEDTKG